MDQRRKDPIDEKPIRTTSGPEQAATAYSGAESYDCVGDLIPNRTTIAHNHGMHLTALHTRLMQGKSALHQGLDCWRRGMAHAARLKLTLWSTAINSETRVGLLVNSLRFNSVPISVSRSFTATFAIPKISTTLIPWMSSLKHPPSLRFCRASAQRPIIWSTPTSSARLTA